MASTWLHPLLPGLLLTLAPPAAQENRVDLVCVARDEEGSILARGTFHLRRQGGALEYLHPTSRGVGREPGTMYMLGYYLFRPARRLPILHLPGGGSTTSTGRHGGKVVTGTGKGGPLTTPAGTYPETMVVKTLITALRTGREKADAFLAGTRRLWFARGVGPVRMRYEHGDGRVTEAVLLSCAIQGDRESWFPLAEGNRWTWAWKNGYRRRAVIETCTVGPGKKAATHTREPEMAAVDSRKLALDPEAGGLHKLAPAPARGFHFPYYLFLPPGLACREDLRLLVEMNNSGTVSDDFALHDRRARRLARSSHARRIAEGLEVPLLVPVFPRPRRIAHTYTHSLDEETLGIRSGRLERIDRQLIAMIRDAQALLRRRGLQLRERVFMHGFSASGTFANRFALLHPRVLRAVAAGGVNGIPTFPAARWRERELPWPVGIADLEKLAGAAFDRGAYREVAQFLYMGYLDRNDTTLSRDTYSAEHARLIRTLIGADMGRRWRVSRSIYAELEVPAQCVTYDGTAHTIRPEMVQDVIRFFRANAGTGFRPIEPHRYPFVEFRRIEVAHIKGLYWAGDRRIPEFARTLFDGRGHFIICIEEWLPGQSHRQLRRFRQDAGFEFLLRAPDHPEVRVGPKCFEGNYSDGRGRFQGFVVRLPPAELARLARGVAYTIHPVDRKKKTRWQAAGSVTLVRP